ncbi:fungal-specific transcription factor domain-containing protein [Aspergillus unguis]
MVYRGKPSQACFNCRGRKIRCDLVRPACGQCIRTNRECQGYRDEWVLMLRDETQSVAKKASRALPVSRPVPPTISQALPKNPTTISTKEAICFFLQAHFIPGAVSLTDTLSTFLSGPASSPSQRAVQSTLVAVSSAMLARVRGTNAILQISRQEYGTALQRLNEALADPVESKTNDTLGAVIFLALYEIVVSRVPTLRGIEGWTNHIRGAAALLEHRGLEQLQNDIGSRLVQHLRYQVIVSCLQRDMHVPRSLMQYTFSTPSAKDKDKDTVDAALILIIANLSNLRADIKNKTLENPQQIISAAYAIEADLLAWLAALPPQYTYTTHSSSSSLPGLDRVFEQGCHGLRPYNESYHIYADMWVPNCWNRYRCARVLICEIVVAQLRKIHSSNLQQPSSLSPDLKAQYSTLHATASRLATDICQSVPFHFIGSPPPLNSSASETGCGASSSSYISGLMLLWPLFIAGIVKGPHHPQKKWVLRCLEIVGHTYGLAQALALRDMLAFDVGLFWFLDADGGGGGFFDCMEGDVDEGLPFLDFSVPVL